MAVGMIEIARYPHQVHSETKTVPMVVRLLQGLLPQDLRIHSTSTTGVVLLSEDGIIPYYEVIHPGHEIGRAHV